MKKFSEPLHHFHHRQKENKAKQAPLASGNSKLHRLLDRIIYLVGVLGPIMTLPQALIIWQSRQTAGVSLVSWSAYLVFSLFWLTYGVVHKQRPIIVTYVGWFLVELAIVIGLLVYR